MCFFSSEKKEAGVYFPPPPTALLHGLFGRGSGALLSSVNSASLGRSQPGAAIARKGRQRPANPIPQAASSSARGRSCRTIEVVPGQPRWRAPALWSWCLRRCTHFQHSIVERQEKARLAGVIMAYGPYVNYLRARAAAAFSAFACAAFLERSSRHFASRF